MQLRLAAAIAAVASLTLVAQPTPSEAGGHHLRKHMHEMGQRLERLCPLSWWRHRHEAAPVVKKPVAKKVAMAKAAPKKAAAPLK